MRGEYLGDSYDLVKRFWSESLREIAPLYAYSKFVPPDIRTQYTAATSIPILEAPDGGQLAVLFDPHTGVPLPTERVSRSTASHATLSFIVAANAEVRPRYMICFDQSFHRKHQLTREQQRMLKREFLRERGIASFYYVSHAPFLFMSQDVAILRQIQERLSSLGIPTNRFEWT